MFPLISNVMELRQSKLMLADLAEELEDEGIAFDRNLQTGVMIEVPSAALMSRVFGSEANFFSIGTNDLVQYTLAVDRGNERVAHLYDALHPAVLQLIHMTVRAANEAGIPVSVCGEMATNPLAVPILIGLGLSELSGTPAAIPVVKEIVRALDTALVEADARSALRARTAAEVHAIAAARLRASGLVGHPDIGGWLSQLLENTPATR